MENEKYICGDCGSTFISDDGEVDETENISFCSDCIKKHIKEYNP